jgi:hypothetical protein
VCIALVERAGSGIALAPADHARNELDTEGMTMKRAHRLHIPLVGIVLLVACGRGADGGADQTGEQGPVGEARRTDLGERVELAQARLGVLHDGLDEVGDTVDGRAGRGVDSLRVRAAELRTEIGGLPAALDRSGEHALERIEAGLDSLDREVWTLRFDVADQPETFEAAAARALATIDAQMDTIQARMDGAADRVETETRELWAKFRGQFVELQTRADIIVETANELPQLAFSEARHDFARSVSGLARELRRFAAEVPGDPGDGSGA